MMITVEIFLKLK